MLLLSAVIASSAARREAVFVGIECTISVEEGPSFSSPDAVIARAAKQSLEHHLLPAANRIPTPMNNTCCPSGEVRVPGSERDLVTAIECM
jgi:hypothetical protein